jgi:hypothetical protein
MAKYLEPEVSIGRRAAYVKWLIFGVALPLLPFAARLLAAWLDNATRSLSFTSLFSDGELLVVATVIAAAVIGDLLFDFSGRNEVRGRTTIAVLCALSLLVVVISVLMFGLVTLDNQNRSDAVQQAQHNQTARIEQSTQLLEQSSKDQAQASALSKQAQTLNNRLSVEEGNLHKQIFGAGGTPAGIGPIAAEIETQIKSLRRASDRSRVQATLLSEQAVAHRAQANRFLINSLTRLSIGREQAAIMSVIMFLLSWLTGAVAIWFSTNLVEERRGADA